MNIILASIFVILLLFVLCLWSFSTLIGLFRARGVPFVTLRNKQLRDIDKYVKLHSEDKLVDLGCGDGRVLRLFEKQGLKYLHGYEVNLWAVVLSKIFNFFRRSKTEVYFKNFNKVDLSQYNVVFCYLLDFSLKRLRDKFDRELKPGAKIISYAFEVPEWREPEIIYTNDRNKKLGRIFIYKI